MPRFAIAPVRHVLTYNGTRVSQLPTFYVEALNKAEARKAANRILARPFYTGETYELSIEEV